MPKTLLTPEQYLAIEREAKDKSEYFQGEMFAMAGAGEAHNVLVGNLVTGLNNHLRSRPCRVYPSDMRVRVSATGLYTYPDVVVACGERRFLDERRDTLLNPSLLIEVLSPSTEAYDRGKKFEHYRSIELLREYLLVASDRVHADQYTRQPDGRWLLTSADRLEDSLDLQSIGYRLALLDLYEKVDLPEFQPATAEEVCRFETDLAFLSEVGRRIAPLAARPGLAPEKARVIERAVAALRSLPELTPGIDLQIEIAHRMGGEEFNESYSYLVKLHQRGVEIASSGTQYDAAVGSNSFSLESFKWYADGQVEQKGNRDTWLERLAYALARDYTVNATDESAGT